MQNVTEPCKLSQFQLNTRQHIFSPPFSASFRQPQIVLNLILSKAVCIVLRYIHDHEYDLPKYVIIKGIFFGISLIYSSDILTAHPEGSVLKPIAFYADVVYSPQIMKYGVECHHVFNRLNHIFGPSPSFNPKIALKHLFNCQN
jgi:hypothetical protein